jgi:hypothetical protein
MLPKIINVLFFKRKTQGSWWWRLAWCTGTQNQKRKIFDRGTSKLRFNLCFPLNALSENLSYRYWILDEIKLKITSTGIDNLSSDFDSSMFKNNILLRKEIPLTQSWAVLSCRAESSADRLSVLSSKMTGTTRLNSKLWQHMPVTILSFFHRGQILFQ